MCNGENANVVRAHAVQDAKGEPSNEPPAHLVLDLRSYGGRSSQGVDRVLYLGNEGVSKAGARLSIVGGSFVQLILDQCLDHADVERARVSCRYANALEFDENILAVDGAAIGVRQVGRPDVSTSSEGVLPVVESTFEYPPSWPNASTSARPLTMVSNVWRSLRIIPGVMAVLIVGWWCK